MRILIVNGPNLNLIGQREEEIYGKVSFQSFYDELNSKKDADLDYFQSNIEGELINALQNSNHDGVIINAGIYNRT